MGLECSIFLIIPSAAQFGNETLLIFASFPEKRIYFDFRVNYLHNEVERPIKTEFVIENQNIYEMQKHT